MGNCLVIQESQANNTENLDVQQTEPCTFSTSKHTPGASAQMVIEENIVRADAVQIKLVVKKHQLKEMLTKKLVSIDDIIFLLNKERSKRCEHDKERREWRPALESIPEETQFFKQNCVNCTMQKDFAHT
jgi:hypothetical protein